MLPDWFRARNAHDGFQVLDYYLAKWSETVHQMQFAGNQTRFRSC